MIEVRAFSGTIEEARALARAVLADHAVAAGHRYGETPVVYSATVGGRVIGVLVGRVVYGWLGIDLLAVEPDSRGQGVGAKLLEAAKAEAAAHGCEGLTVDTFDFQAPGFYRRLGFEEVGIVPNREAGRTRRYFLKRLAPTG